MIPKELDDLIKEYLTDGHISEAERRVLLRKAENMGLDLEEIDLYITAQEQKIDNKVAAEKKVAIGKVCPKCGRQVEAMTLRCECGYEFKNERTISSVQKFYEDLNNLKLSDQEILSCSQGMTDTHGKIVRDADGNPQLKFVEKKVTKLLDKKKHELISSFPVPNTKEDIIEFLALAVSNSQIKGGKFWGSRIGRIKLGAIIMGLVAIICFIICLISGSDVGESFVLAFTADIYAGGLMSPILVECQKELINYNDTAKIWRAKFDQILMKGRSLRGDAEFQRQLDYYENIINAR